MVRICVVLLRFPLCVLGLFVFPFRVQVGWLGCSILLGNWCGGGGSVVLGALGVLLYLVIFILGVCDCGSYYVLYLGFRDIRFSGMVTLLVPKGNPFACSGSMSYIALTFHFLVFVLWVGVGWYSYWGFSWGSGSGWAGFVTSGSHVGTFLQGLRCCSVCFVSVLAFFCRVGMGFLCLGGHLREWCGGPSPLVCHGWHGECGEIGFVTGRCCGGSCICHRFFHGLFVLM